MIKETYKIMKKHFNKEIYSFDENQNENIKIEKYQKHYSNSFFWTKIKKIAKNVGLKVVCYALTLYYVLQKNDIPIAERGIIIGTLGYFILPFDLMPDFILGLGYTDDVGVMLIAIHKCMQYVDTEVKNQVYLKLNDWFDTDYEEVEKILNKAFKKKSIFIKKN